MWSQKGKKGRREREIFCSESSGDDFIWGKENQEVKKTRRLKESKIEKQGTEGEVQAEKKTDWKKLIHSCPINQPEWKTYGKEVTCKGTRKWAKNVGNKKSPSL